MNDFRDLTEKILAFSKERDWLQFHTPDNLAKSAVIEAAELLEHFQWRTPAQAREHIRQHREDIADEISDVMIYLLELAHVLEIDPRSAIETKIAKNARKYPVEKSKGSNRKYTEFGGTE